MSAELIYRTTSSVAIDWYHTAHEQVDLIRKARNVYQDRMLAEFGPAELPEHVKESRQGERLLWVRGSVAYALDSGYNEQPPEGSGWRLDSKDRNWQPKLATKAGKARAAELAALSTYDLRDHLPEIGVSQMVFADSHLYQPGLEFDAEEQALYITWRSVRCADEALAAQANVPEIEWEEIPRSQWYAREERLSRESA